MFLFVILSFVIAIIMSIMAFAVTSGANILLRIVVIAAVFFASLAFGAGMIGDSKEECEPRNTSRISTFLLGLLLGRHSK